MICATLKDAKAKLNQLVEKAVEGEDVILMKGSKHVAVIVPITDADLCLSLDVSDRQAHRLWEKIHAEKDAGKMKTLNSPVEIIG